jgi:hypothetical protein
MFMTSAQPAQSPFRKKLEMLSTPLLLTINTWPKWLIPLLMLGFLLVGLFVPGVVGGFFIFLVGLFVGWLLLLSWPLLDTKSKFFRLVLVVIILFSGLTQILLVK